MNITLENKGNVVAFPGTEVKETPKVKIKDIPIETSSNAVYVRTVVNRKVKDGSNNYVRLLTKNSYMLYIIGASIRGKKKGEPKLHLEIADLHGKRKKPLIIMIDGDGNLYNTDKEGNHHPIIIESKKTLLGKTGILHDSRIQKTGFNPDWLK